MEAKIQELNKYREALVKKLEELQKKRQEMIDAKDMTKMSQAAKYRQFGDELLNTDPEMARNYYAQADKLEADKNKGTQTPDQTRQQLRISRDNAIRVSLDQNSSEKLRELAREEVKIISNEMSKATPNSQLAFSKIDELYKGTGVKKTPGPDDNNELDTFDTLSASITTELKAIPYQGSALKEKAVELKTQIRNAKLEKADEDRLIKQIDEHVKSKGGNPEVAEAKETEQFIKEYMQNVDSKNMIKGVNDSKASLQSFINLFNSGKSAPIILEGFKKVMGNMTGGEYGVASGDATSAALGELGGVFSALSSAFNTKTFNDAEDAAQVVNDFIDGVAKFKQDASAEGMLPSKYKGNEKAIKMFSESAGVQAIENALSKLVIPAHVKAPDGGSNAGVVKPHGIGMQGGKYYAIDENGKGKEITEKQYSTYKALGVNIFGGK